MNDESIQPPLGLLSDFIMQTTDDFFFGDMGNPYYSQSEAYNGLR
jgi:hypothetical protein